ncbi:uncharacterized protein MONOS_18209 [Monocercomonoides exilis]|uniref:uncharacterized protein n=1 Tax=Monocercomonoides exilis TaxID=2049356 RepID=UPI00355955E8|nr:hypothetical protein MONOS_18209 [Monocercomonoides exilis]
MSLFEKELLINSIHNNLQSLANALALIVLVGHCFWQHLLLNVPSSFPLNKNRNRSDQLVPVHLNYAVV